MSYEHIPKSLFEKFVNKIYLDPAKCENVSIKDIDQGSSEHFLRGFELSSSVQEMNIEINVKDQN